MTQQQEVDEIIRKYPYLHGTLSADYYGKEVEDEDDLYDPFLRGVTSRATD